MFSQFRNAVEHLATQPMRRSSSQDSDASNGMSRTNSVEGGVSSPTQLADSALSNIRKSLQAQRPVTPARAGINGVAGGGAHDPNKSRSRLEERLRASLSFGIGEMSGPSTELNTPISTKAPTPLPTTDATPASPTKTPLPDSPISLAAENGTGIQPPPLSLGDPLGASSAVSSSFHPPISPTTKSKPESDLPVDITDTADNVPLNQPTPLHHSMEFVDSSPVEMLERVAEWEEDDEGFQGRRYAEAQMPLPPTPPSESSELPPALPPTSGLEHQPTAVDDTDKDDVSPAVPTNPPPTGPGTEADLAITAIPSTNNADGDAAGTDVDALRQQLNRFKERFTGREETYIYQCTLTGWVCADVSSSFKRLQAERLAADKLLQDLTPLQSIQDTDGLREYIKNINLQSEVRRHTTPR